jgi:hypothetical protein
MDGWVAAAVCAAVAVAVLLILWLLTRRRARKRTAPLLPTTVVTDTAQLTGPLPPGFSHSWEWLDGAVGANPPGSWRRYSAAVARGLEGQLAAGNRSHVFTAKGTTTYSVDLRLMTQTNVDTGHVRQVRRRGPPACSAAYHGNPLSSGAAAAFVPPQPSAPPVASAPPAAYLPQASAPVAVDLGASGGGAAAAAGAQMKTFGTSAFKACYDRIGRGTVSLDTLFRAVEALAVGHCRAVGAPAPEAAGQRLAAELRKQAEGHNNATLQGGTGGGGRAAVTNAAIVVWTSDERVRVPHPDDKALHAIINAAIRDDGGHHGDAPLLVDAAAKVARCITECISNKPNLPRGDSVAQRTACYRGSAILAAHRAWYDQQRGTQFRVPQFLSTTKYEAVACNGKFPAALRDGEEQVIFTVLMPQHEQMLGASPIKSGQFQYEGEYLFSPFAVFVVDAVAWRAGTRADPHRITLVAEADALRAPLDLPLAPRI